MATNLYTSGDYLERNPTWHSEESPWKVKYIMPMLARHHLLPNTICEVGCGAGEVLRLMQTLIKEDCTFWGYDISPQAFAMCQDKANARLHFKLADIKQEQDAFFDLILVLDVIEHLEDYFSFLRDLKSKSRYKLFLIPLEVSVQGTLRAKVFLESRDLFGHLHYFTKETALRDLADAGYEVIDTAYALDWDRPTTVLRSKLLRIPRRLCFAIQQDWAIRLLGGARLLVLAQ